MFFCFIATMNSSQNPLAAVHYILNTATDPHFKILTFSLCLLSMPTFSTPHKITGQA